MQSQSESRTGAPVPHRFAAEPRSHHQETSHEIAVGFDKDMNGIATARTSPAAARDLWKERLSEWRGWSECSGPTVPHHGRIHLPGCALRPAESVAFVSLPRPGRRHRQQNGRVTVLAMAPCGQLRGTMLLTTNQKWLLREKRGVAILAFVGGPDCSMPSANTCLRSQMCHQPPVITAHSLQAYAVGPR